MNIFRNAVRPRWNLASFAAALRARRSAALRARQSAHLLHDLSDSQLKDIGLTRSDIGRIIRAR
jgi:uncharacterized protein YjiS (DUF1127 family)